MDVIYMCGFLDCAVVIGNTSGKHLCMSIESKEQHKLNFVNQMFNNIFTITNNRISLSGAKCRPLLDIMKCYSLNTKVNVAEKLIDEKDKIKRHSLCEQMKRIQYHHIEDLDIRYITGVFDANGCIYKQNDTMIVSIHHKNNSILSSIQCIYECHFHDKLYFYSKKSQIEFLSEIHKYLSLKKKLVSETLQIAKGNKGNTKDLKLYKNLNVGFVQKVFNDILNYTPDELIKYNKMRELEKIKDNKALNKQIYIGNCLNIKPKLIFCDTPKKLNIWNYYRDKTSSICSSHKVGRNVNILVMDENTNKYIGLISLGSKAGREEILTRKQFPNLKKDMYHRYIVNISTCVPLQPFGWNCNGGKLLVKLVFSREISQYWYDKYADPMLVATTMGINGKSAMYDRLPEIKFQGKTKGMSAYHIPEEVINLSKQLVNQDGLTINRRGKMERLVQICNMYNIPKEFLYHKKEKGVFSGRLYPHKKDFYEFDIQNLKTIEQITNEWYSKYATRRISTRVELKKNLEIYTVDSFKDTRLYVLPYL